MGLDRKYLVWALGYAVVGMGVGIYMAASKNHAEYVAHAPVDVAAREQHHDRAAPT